MEKTKKIDLSFGQVDRSYLSLSLCWKSIFARPFAALIGPVSQLRYLSFLKKFYKKIWKKKFEKTYPVESASPNAPRCRQWHPGPARNRSKSCNCTCPRCWGGATLSVRSTWPDCKREWNRWNTLFRNASWDELERMRHLCLTKNKSC